MKTAILTLDLLGRTDGTPEGNQGAPESPRKHKRETLEMQNKKAERPIEKRQFS